ncbi:MAG: chromate transporter [Chitinophagales bacterium]
MNTGSHHQHYSIGNFVYYFFCLGTTGFGGPVALVNNMRKDLVEKRKWISEEDYNQGLALAQLAPGPLAAQLAIYLGYVGNKIIGATLAGLAFVLPSFLMVVLLGWAYLQFGGLPWMQSVFYGVGAAVIGIVTISGYTLSRKTLKNDWLLWLIFGVLAFFTFTTEQENIWLILSGGFVVWVVRIPPSSFKKNNSILIPMFFLQVVAQFTTNQKLLQVWWFFLKAGTFVFGSGLAIVPFLYGGVVKDFHWLNERQFLDAVAVAMITPGPVVITVGFIGYLVAGFPGACIAALATFLPCYLFTVVPAPYFRKYGKNHSVKAIADGITAAAVGAIASAVIVLAKRQFTDIPSALIALVTVLTLIRFKKIQEPLIILAAALAGLLIEN